MLKYILKRILSSIVVLIGVVTITFFIARVIPSNPEVKWAGQRATAEQLERRKTFFVGDEFVFFDFKVKVETE